MDFCTDYRCPVRKLLSLHFRKSNPTPKFLGTTKGYFVCHIGQNISDIFDLCLHWVSVVLDFTPCLIKLGKSSWAIWTKRLSLAGWLANLTFHSTEACGVASLQSKHGSWLSLNYKWCPSILYFFMQPPNDVSFFKIFLVKFRGA